MGDVERRFVEGDVAAFEALFKAYQREVYGWIVRLVRDPAAAEDLTIETFWRIYRSRARFDCNWNCSNPNWSSKKKVCTPASWWLEVPGSWSQSRRGLASMNSDE